MRVLADFHHSSLLRSLVLLFEDRLGMELYRPIGMDWFTEGFWAINDQEDTAKQFLEPHSIPGDKTSPLNEGYRLLAPGGFPGANYQDVFMCEDPGRQSMHKACTLDYFKNNQFDYVIASIPAHVPVFSKLIRDYQPHAKLIVQMGNNWDIGQYRGMNVLASIAMVHAPGVNAKFYHQEFDLDVFKPEIPTKTGKIYSFVNVIEKAGVAWPDYNEIKKLLSTYEIKAFGGQCPDGNMTGPHELAEAMRQAEFVFHVKPGGDGFGHIIHNAYAIGRPVITRSSHYRGQLAADLLQPGTYLDLDTESHEEIAERIVGMTSDELRLMGYAAHTIFKQVVDYDQEANEIKQWLTTF